MHKPIKRLKLSALGAAPLLLYSCSISAPIDLEVSARADSTLEAFQAELVATLKAIDPMVLDSSIVKWEDAGKTLDAYVCNEGPGRNRGCVTMILDKRKLRAAVYVGVFNPARCFSRAQYAWAKTIADFILRQHEGRAKLTRDPGECQERRSA